MNNTQCAVFWYLTSSLDLTTDGGNRKGHLLNKSSSSELSFLKKRNDIERKNITLSMKEGSLRSNAKKSSDHKKQGGHPHGRAHQHGHSHQYGHSVIGGALPGAAGKNLKKSATKLRVHAARFNGSDVLSGSSGHGSGGHHRHKSGGDRVAQEIVASSIFFSTNLLLQVKSTDSRHFLTVRIIWSRTSRRWAAWTKAIIHD